MIIWHVPIAGQDTKIFTLVASPISIFIAEYPSHVDIYHVGYDSNKRRGWHSKPNPQAPISQVMVMTLVKPVITFFSPILRG